MTLQQFSCRQVIDRLGLFGDGVSAHDRSRGIEPLLILAGALHDTRRLALIIYCDVRTTRPQRTCFSLLTLADQRKQSQTETMLTFSAVNDNYNTRSSI